MRRRTRRFDCFCKAAGAFLPEDRALPRSESADVGRNVSCLGARDGTLIGLDGVNVEDASPAIPFPGLSVFLLPSRLP